MKIQAEEKREKERLRNAEDDSGGSCIGFEGPGAELVRTNDYN